jgi:hypothetical protein
MLMFKRIVSQLSLSPSVAQNLAFYARRLKQESVTRTFSMIAAVLLVGLQFTVITAPPTNSNAASPNDLIYGGITSQADLLAKYDASPQLQALYTDFGITRANLAATTQTTINSRDHSLNSLGRESEGIGYATISADGVTYWAHHLYQFDTGSNVTNGSSYSVLQGTSSTGAWFAVMFACGNIVFHTLPTVPPPPPPPPPNAAPVLSHTATACLQPITGTADDPLHPNDSNDPTTVNLKVKGVSNASVVAIATTPDGKGFWAAAADGGVFAYGDAAFHGSMGGQKLNAPVVGMAVTSGGAGYWLVGADGGVFSFGNASFKGSMGGKTLVAPISGIAAVGGGSGYVLVAGDGGVFNFGSSSFGSLAAIDLGTVKTSGPPSNSYSFPYSASWATYAKNGRTFELVATDSAGSSTPIDFTLPTNCTPTTTTPPPKTPPPKTPPPTTPPPKTPPPKTPPPVTGSPAFKLEKSAFNATQNVDAIKHPAHAGDTINYILSVTNTGKASGSYTFSDDFTSVLQYADIINAGGGTVIPGSSPGISLIAWPETTITPGQTVYHNLSVKVKDPIPATPVGASDPKSYDLQMINTFGNNVIVAVAPPAPKQIETAAAQLPDTGSSTSAIIVLLFAAMVIYFYLRNRQLMTEIKLLHSDYQGGN